MRKRLKTHKKGSKMTVSSESSASTESVKSNKSSEHTQKNDPSDETRFRQVSQYKQALINSFRSWSLINASRLMRWLRIGMAGILFVVSVMAIIIADNWAGIAPAFFRSIPFYLLVIAGFSFFYAAGLLLLGFLRGLAVPTIAILTVYSLYTVIRLESTLADRSLILRLFVVLLACVLYGLILHFALKGYRKRHDLFNWIYKKDLQIIGVDIALKDLLPIAGYTERIMTIISIEQSIDEDQQIDRIDRINGWYHNHLSVRQMLSCGFIFNTAKNELTLIAYSRVDAASANEAYCSRILSRRRIKASVHRQTDAGWQTYLEQLYPDPATLLDIINEQQLQMLEDQGIDLQDAYPIRIELRFPDDAHRQDARLCLTDAGYVVTIDDQADAKAQGELDEFVESSLAFVDLTTRLGLERLNTITRGIIKLIRPFNGDLFGWELTGLENCEQFGINGLNDEYDKMYDDSEENENEQKRQTDGQTTPVASEKREPDQTKKKSE